jgi:predicted N-acyltransferase
MKFFNLNYFFYDIFYYEICFYESINYTIENWLKVWDSKSYLKYLLNL